MRQERVWLRQFVARVYRLAGIYVETRGVRTLRSGRAHLADPIRRVILSRFDARARFRERARRSKK
jgi:hypothetical protein